MPTRTRPLLDRRRFLALGLGALVAACAGTQDRIDAGRDTAGGVRGAAPGDGGPTRSPRPTRSPAPQPPAPPSPAPPAPPAPTGDDEPTAPAPAYPTGIVPTSISIPAIGVDASVVRLQLTADEVEVPTDFDDAGWWVQTREPGEIGPAVVGGHVDSTTGPAVFFGLDRLSPGDQVVVHGADDERRFVVSEPPIRVRKDDRPPEVFGFGGPRPELRLITCGGEFDPASGHYVDNVVVFCHADATTV